MAHPLRAGVGYRKWALSKQQATMTRAGSRGLCAGVLALKQAVLVTEEGDRLSILSLLNDRLTELPLVGRTTPVRLFQFVMMNVSTLSQERWISSTHKAPSSWSS